MEPSGPQLRQLRIHLESRLQNAEHELQHRLEEELTEASEEQATLLRRSNLRVTLLMLVNFAVLVFFLFRL